jgi:hypothetical protein
MSWQAEIKGKTLDEAVNWFLEPDRFVQGDLIDHEVYKDVHNPFKDRNPDVIKLHRIWVLKRRPDGELFTFCADFHEYDEPDEPFFANRIMGLDEGPWGLTPPFKFGKRPLAGGDVLADCPDCGAVVEVQTGWVTPRHKRCAAGKIPVTFEKLRNFATSRDFHAKKKVG